MRKVMKTENTVDCIGIILGRKTKVYSFVKPKIDEEFMILVRFSTNPSRKTSFKDLSRLRELCGCNDINGKILGECKCTKITKYEHINDGQSFYIPDDVCRALCADQEYLGVISLNRPIYVWDIEDFKLYDKPMKMDNIEAEFIISAFINNSEKVV